jgi:hypothetical protein
MVIQGPKVTQQKNYPAVRQICSSILRLRDTLEVKEMTIDFPFETEIPFLCSNQMAAPESTQSLAYAESEPVRDAQSYLSLTSFRHFALTTGATLEILGERLYRLIPILSDA